MGNLSAEWKGKTGAGSLSGAELRIMDIVWQENGTSARNVAANLSERYGYSASATYTLINRCIKKGTLERVEPGYFCRPLVSREDAQDAQTDSLLERLYDNDPVELFRALVNRGKLTAEQLADLKQVVDAAQ